MLSPREHISRPGRLPPHRTPGVVGCRLLGRLIDRFLACWSMASWAGWSMGSKAGWSMSLPLSLLIRGVTRVTKDLGLLGDHDPLGGKDPLSAAGTAWSSPQYPRCLHFPYCPLFHVILFLLHNRTGVGGAGRQLLVLFQLSSMYGGRGVAP